MSFTTNAAYPFFALKVGSSVEKGGWKVSWITSGLRQSENCQPVAG